MNSELEIIRLDKAIECLDKAMCLLKHNDKIKVQSIIDDYVLQINSYNNRNLEVVNPTKGELGGIRSSLKKIVFGKYLNHILKNHNESKITAFKKSEIYLQHEKKEDYCYCDYCIKEDTEIEVFYEEFDKPINKLTADLIIACNNTQLPKEIVSAKILLSRKNPNYWLGKDKLDWELSEYLKIKMLEAFNKQNASFIKEKLTIKT